MDRERDRRVCPGLGCPAGGPGSGRDAERACAAAALRGRRRPGGRDRRPVRKEQRRAHRAQLACPGPCRLRRRGARDAHLAGHRPRRHRVPRLPRCRPGEREGADAHERQAPVPAGERNHTEDLRRASLIHPRCRADRPGVPCAPMGHIVLLGDSILDNAAYVGRGPAVIDQLRTALPPQWTADLLAVDGDVASSVPIQLEGLPESATHLVVSAGGNDALMRTALLEMPAATVAGALLVMAEAVEDFERDYRAMVASVTARELRVVLCSIYFSRFQEEAFQRVAIMALAGFNDAILRVAFDARLPVIDLRLVCTAPAHYDNEIEPSSAGGERIVAAIMHAVTTHDFSAGRSTIYS